MSKPSGVTFRSSFGASWASKWQGLGVVSLGLRAPGRCEDAFFFSPTAAGVADGVGQMEQFSEYGVDAAK